MKSVKKFRSPQWLFGEYKKSVARIEYKRMQQGSDGWLKVFVSGINYRLTSLTQNGVSWVENDTFVTAFIDGRVILVSSPSASQSVCRSAEFTALTLRYISFIVLYYIACILTASASKSARMELGGSPTTYADDCWHRKYRKYPKSSNVDVWPLPKTRLQRPRIISRDHLTLSTSLTLRPCMKT